MAKTTQVRDPRETQAALAGWADPGERIRQALAKDELALYCQPIVSLERGAGFPIAEVLVRLHAEEKALLPPGEFLPIFEQFRRMPELDCWVARKVIRHIARGSRIPRFSINISSQSLADAAVPRAIAMELVSAGVSGTGLLFEIDEADSLARLEAAKKFARAIRSVGCGLMLDGFGRRSHSFAALKALQVHIVKVDGSIVRKLLTDRRAEAKLRAIQKVGEAMGFKLLAEMVEDQDILVRLKALGVDYAQGFGVCEPHPIERLERRGARTAA
jgi:EAL domain-containing protein (putative c-di-GMP-specific phosphodiesterase class I)